MAAEDLKGFRPEEITKKADTGLKLKDYADRISGYPSGMKFLKSMEEGQGIVLDTLITEEDFFTSIDRFYTAHFSNMLEANLSELDKLNTNIKGMDLVSLIVSKIQSGTVKKRYDGESAELAILHGDNFLVSDDGEEIQFYAGQNKNGLEFVVTVDEVKAYQQRVTLKEAVSGQCKTDIETLIPRGDYPAKNAVADIFGLHGNTDQNKQVLETLFKEYGVEMFRGGDDNFLVYDCDAGDKSGNVISKQDADDIIRKFMIELEKIPNDPEKIKKLVAFIDDQVSNDEFNERLDALLSKYGVRKKEGSLYLVDGNRVVGKRMFYGLNREILAIHSLINQEKKLAESLAKAKVDVTLLKEILGDGVALKITQEGYGDIDTISDSEVIITLELEGKGALRITTSEDRDVWRMGPIGINRDYKEILLSESIDKLFEPINENDSKSQFIDLNLLSWLKM